MSKIIPAQQVFLSLGANLGDKRVTLNQAIIAIGKLKQVKLVKRSSFYQTAPVHSSGDDYLNLVLELTTDLAPLKLLEQLQQIENAFGRKRPYKNAPRTLDIDILLFANQVINHPRLKVPHPLMFERAFVLVPLVEIAPTLVSQQQLEVVKQQHIKKLFDKKCEV